MSKVYIAAFTREEDLLEAVAAAQRAQWPVIETYTPYPVHGLGAAMGLRPSQLGKACFLFGLFGVALAFGFQFWSTASDWPLNIGGQPWNSLPAFVPIAFETMVLCAGLGLVGTWLLRCSLYPGSNLWLPRRGETDDRFVLVLGEPGADADASEFRRILREQMTTNLEEREL
jgi:hypothetical protein